ncbi:MAG TPA: hypothetical protein VMS56_10950 [Thermoanaerobaculia bacterium]|nr:hypothetical protein [Thermoanaerobaculia bacterium]
MNEDLIRKLEDVVRQELLLMGYDYPAVVGSIERSPASEGVVIRLHPPYEDVEVETPEPDLPDDVFAARLSRRLRVALEAPERPPRADED